MIVLGIPSVACLLSGLLSGLLAAPQLSAQAARSPEALSTRSIDAGAMIAASPPAAAGAPATRPRT